MSSPIVLQDMSGLAQGISSAGSALSQALQFRNQEKIKEEKKKSLEQRQQKSIEIMSQWASKYDKTQSPLENVGSLQKALVMEGIDVSTIQPLLQDIIKKSVSQEGEQFGASQIFGQSAALPQPTNGDQLSQPEVSELQPPQPTQPLQPTQPPPPTRDMTRFSNDQLVGMAGSQNRIVSNISKAEIEKRKLDQQVNKDDRDWHSKFSIDQEKKVSALREAVPKKNAALTHARSAIQSGQTGIMTGTWLADMTGIEVFRGVEGAQLEVAAKEHFFGNMSRVSAKAQNIFFEKMLKGMFAQVGQTEETAMAFTEMLQGELNMDEAFVQEFDKFSAEDESRFGYPRKDVERRARQSVEHLEELNLDRSLYRIQRLTEAQQSSKKIRENLMKPVASGTPLTLEKKFLFMDKFEGDTSSAIKAAKRLGYKIPNGSDVRLYMMPNKQFTEQMRGK